jgi:uncharacterized integral membrane protein
VTETDEARAHLETEAPLDDDELEGVEWDERTVSELVEQVTRDTAVLVAREVELRAAEHAPAIRRGTRDAALAVVAGVALVTAFALANWAGVAALDLVLSDWLAPLLLAAVWAALGGTLLVALRSRYRELLLWAAADPDVLARERRQARDVAESNVRASLDDLSGAIADEAEARIRNAVVPAAGEIVEMGDDLLDAADELTDSIDDVVEGGGIADWSLDLVLYPGRLGVRVARAALGRSPHRVSRNGEGAPGAEPVAAETAEPS